MLITLWKTFVKKRETIKNFVKSRVCMWKSLWIMWKSSLENFETEKIIGNYVN